VFVQPDVLISRDLYLNSPVTCDVFTPINIDLWKTDTPALQVEIQERREHINPIQKGMCHEYIPKHKNYFWGENVK
jgi:hypothetical protein